MILQEMVYPDKEICTVEQMYLRTQQGKVTFDDGAFHLMQDTIVSTLTYFNAFSIGKWIEYTDIEQISMHLFLKGQGQIELCIFDGSETIVLERRDFIHTEITEESFTLLMQEETKLSFVNKKESVLCFARIIAKEECLLTNIQYQTTKKPIRQIELAIGICTYRREEYVQRTLKMLADQILCDVHSPLYHHVKVYVSDNGNTLDTTQTYSDAVKVFYNKNAGGTGGFTRCMIETMEDKTEFTHILLMDDDIKIHADTIKRTWLLLAYANEKYKDSVVGGALLRTDHPNIQHTNAEIWDIDRVQTMHQGLDMCNVTQLSQNEEILRSDYNGWWYCCIPVATIKEVQLPLPFFIHMDDIEYGIRLDCPIMTMNGIGVWHDSFEHRKASSVEYYDMRNLLTANAIHNSHYTKKHAKKRVMRHLVFQLLKYRYEDWKLTIKGVEDFCKGTEFYKTTDPVKLHQQIMQMGYQMTDQSQTLQNCDCLEDIKKKEQKGTVSDRAGEEEPVSLYQVKAHSKMDFLTLNGWLLPGKRKLVPLPMGCCSKDLFRVSKVVYYDPESKKGFVTQRKWRKLFELLWQCHKVNRLLDQNFDKAVKDYQKNYKEITNMAFWKRYLEL